MKVVILGAGNVGATCAFELMRENFCNIFLIDVVEGLAEGKALDLSQAAASFDFTYRIEGGSDYAALEGADVVVITAGKPRRPGMSRLDLIKENGGIVKSLVKEVKERCPQSILIVVTNPLDLMVYLSFKVSQFPKGRIVGMGSLLDSFRFRYFLARKLGLNPFEVEGWVLGTHDRNMVPLFSTVRWRGFPLSFSEDEICEISKKTKEGGAEIVSLLKTGSAFYAPGVSAARLVKAVLRDEKTLLPAAIVLEGEYGFSGAVISLPCIVGRNGVEKVVELPISSREKELLQESVEKFKENLKIVEEEVGY
jgi:malate dehydrogenase